MPQFFVNVLRPGHGVRDFRPQEFPETLSKAMHRHFDHPFAHVQLSGNLRIRCDALLAPNEPLQFLEKPGFVRRSEFLS